MGVRNDSGVCRFCWRTRDASREYGVIGGPHGQTPFDAGDAHKVDCGFRTWLDNLTGYIVFDDVSFTPRLFPDRGAKLFSLQAEDANTLSDGSAAPASVDVSSANKVSKVVTITYNAAAAVNPSRSRV